MRMPSWMHVVRIVSVTYHMVPFRVSTNGGVEVLAKRELDEL